MASPEALRPGRRTPLPIYGRPCGARSVWHVAGLSDRKRIRLSYGSSVVRVSFWVFCYREVTEEAVRSPGTLEGGNARSSTD